ncbi:MAG: hypothetical protein ACXAAN_11910 [Candidatus Thorarchaeota archaeon]
MTDETSKLNRDFLGKEYHTGPHIVEPERIPGGRFGRDGLQYLAGSPC